MERDETLRIFLDQAGSHRLLDRAGETTLARTIDRGRSARAALAVTTDPSERHRLERVAEDGLRARDRFVEANLRLVVSVALTFQGRGLPLADLVQEGNAGLLRAVDGFDWRRGFKFSTYAVWWIRQAIQRALSEQGHSLRLSSTGADDLARVKRTIELFEEEHRRRPTIDEVVASTGLPTHRVARILDATAPLLSLDAPATSSDEGPPPDPPMAVRWTFHLPPFAGQPGTMQRLEIPESDSRPVLSPKRSTDIPSLSSSVT